MIKDDNETFNRTQKQLEEGITPECKKLVREIVKDDDEIFKSLAKR